MLDSFSIYEELSQTFDEPSAKVLTKTLSKIYNEMANVVSKEEFKELKGVVFELAEAQKRTEERLDSLTERVEQLAEAQRKTEQRLDSLTEKVEQLAEAQRKTEEVVRGLVKDMADVKTRLSGLSDTVGYSLEDKLIPFMGEFVKNYYGATVKLVERKNLIYPDGRFDEINLYVEAERDGLPLIIIGESKAKPGKRDIKRFLKLKERVSRYFSDKEVKGFLVGYIFHPEVEKYLQEIKEIDCFKTYEIERIARRIQY